MFRPMGRAEVVQVIDSAGKSHGFVRPHGEDLWYSGDPDTRTPFRDGGSITGAELAERLRAAVAGR